MVKNLVMMLGIVLLVIGGLGFVPAAATGGLVLGMFEVGVTKGIIYVVSGALAVFFASRGAHDAKNFAKIFGVLFGFAAVVGFVYGNSVLGLFSVTAAGNWLHAVLALVLLGLGFFGAGAGHDMRHRTRDQLEASQ